MSTFSTQINPAMPTLEQIGSLAIKCVKADNALRKAFGRYDNEKLSGQDNPTSYDPQRIEFLRVQAEFRLAVQSYLDDQDGGHAPTT